MAKGKSCTDLDSDSLSEFFHKWHFSAVYDFDSEDDNTPMTYDEKRQLSLDINRVSNDS